MFLVCLLFFDVYHIYICDIILHVAGLFGVILIVGLCLHMSHLPVLLHLCKIYFSIFVIFSAPSHSGGRVGGITGRGDYLYRVGCISVQSADCGETHCLNAGRGPAGPGES